VLAEWDGLARIQVRKPRAVSQQRRGPGVPVIRRGAQARASRPVAFRDDTLSSERSSDFGEDDVDADNAGSDAAAPRRSLERPAFARAEYELFTQDMLWYTSFPQLVQTACRKARRPSRAYVIGAGGADWDTADQELELDHDSDEELGSSMQHPMLSGAVTEAMRMLGQDLSATTALKLSARSQKMIAASKRRRKALSVHRPHSQRGRKVANTAGTSIQHMVVGGTCAPLNVRQRVTRAAPAQLDASLKEQAKSGL
jgi:hypothetical protein